MPHQQTETMGSVSILLARIQDEDDSARSELFSVIYDEMRDMAGNVLRGDRGELSLQPTELVHEAVLRLLDPRALSVARDRRYVFSACCRAMRQILADHGRARNAIKRGRGYQRQDLDMLLDDFDERSGGNFGDLNEQLSVMETNHPRLVQIVHCRFFGGMSFVEIAEMLEVSVKTIQRDWRLAKAMLKRALVD